VDHAFAILDELLREREREPLFAAICARLRAVFLCDRVAILVMTDDHTKGYIWAGDPPPPQDAPLLSMRVSDFMGGASPSPEPVVVNREDVRHLPRHVELWDRLGVHASVRGPLVVAGRVLGMVAWWSSTPHAFDGADLELARRVALVVSIAVQRSLVLERLDRLRRRAVVENDTLLAEVGARMFRPLVGPSEAMRAVHRLIDTVAPTGATVLITGESGTGKGLVARMIHDASPRCGGPMITVNCAALPAELAESELLGHEAGAFTSAVKRRKGRFELADGGTLFLDEVGELPAQVQAKLLRVLQERELERVGGVETIRVDVRLVAATNRDLPQLVARGRFRADLYYRLNVFPVEVPPLRERADDIPVLVDAFLERVAARHRRPRPRVGADALLRMQAYEWPGNVRELENAIERAFILSTGGDLDLDAILPAAAPPADAEEAGRYRAALVAADWVIEGPSGAAVRLAVHPNTLRYRLKRLGIDRPR
jgi:formate hydrogenlyase transcriptional activator